MHTGEDGIVNLCVDLKPKRPSKGEAQDVGRRDESDHDSFIKLLEGVIQSRAPKSPDTSGLLDCDADLSGVVGEVVIPQHPADFPRCLIYSFNTLGPGGVTPVGFHSQPRKIPSTANDVAHRKPPSL